jgi:glutamine synthetase
MSKNFRRFSPIAAVRSVEASASQPPMNITEIFGENTLTLDTLKSRLPKGIWKELKKTITDHEPLNADVADVVAVS